MVATRLFGCDDLMLFDNKAPVVVSDTGLAVFVATIHLWQYLVTRLLRNGMELIISVIF